MRRTSILFGLLTAALTMATACDINIGGLDDGGGGTSDAGDTDGAGDDRGDGRGSDDERGDGDDSPTTGLDDNAPADEADPSDDEGPGDADSGDADSADGDSADGDSGDGDRGDGIGRCQDADDCSACFDCEVSEGGSCHDAWIACGEDAACVEFESCFDDCAADAKTDQEHEDCFTTCESLHPDGVRGYFAYADCAFDACPTSCAA